MFTRYRAVLGPSRRVAVQRRTAMVARLPISIDTLGIVLLVTGLGRSYGLAGALTAAYTIANGLMAIVQGRLLDRLGQSRVLPVVGLGLRGRDRRARRLPGVGLAGPRGVRRRRGRRRGVPADRLVRARAVVLRAGGRAGRDPDGLRPGVGDRRGDLHHRPDRGHRARHHLAPLGRSRDSRWSPASVGPSTSRPSASTQPAPHPPGHAAGARPPMPWRSVVPLAVVCFALGSMFAAAEVATVAFSGEQGAKAFAGVLLASWALGSMLAGLVTGTLRLETPGRVPGPGRQRGRWPW